MLEKNINQHIFQLEKCLEFALAKGTTENNLIITLDVLSRKEVISF